MPRRIFNSTTSGRARLNNPVTPMQAETALQLTLAPKADTARYDRLRPTHLDDQEVRHA